MHTQNIVKSSIKAFTLVFFVSVLTVTFSLAQSTASEQQIIKLSRDKWQWMAEKNVDKLAQLFDDKAKFVHMSGTWKKDEELEIIKTGSIWYKKADVHDVAVELFDDTAIIWSRITLESMVRGNEAKVEFTVTEVYKRVGSDWKMQALTFSSVRDTHVIKH
jgi:hypothetical protein